MKALIIGATGATGKDLLELLLKNENYTEIHIFVRRHIEQYHPKLTTHIINFDREEEWRDGVQGDVLFSCLGTTLKQAGSKEHQWKIDYDYQYNFAKVAKENRVGQLILISSAMANKNSSFYYMKMKGLLEEEVKKLNFKKLVILRPPALIRKHSNRRNENIGVKVIQWFNRLGLFKNAQPMSTEFLAQKMITTSLKKSEGILVLEPKEIREL